MNENRHANSYDPVANGQGDERELLPTLVIGLLLAALLLALSAAYAPVAGAGEGDPIASSADAAALERAAWARFLSEQTPEVFAPSNYGTA